MRYTVETTDSFTMDVDHHLDYLMREKVPRRVADRWLARLFDLVYSLDEWPERYPVDQQMSTSREEIIHRLNFGDYLIFYRVDHSHLRVELIAFVHGAPRRDTPR